MYSFPYGVSCTLQSMGSHCQMVAKGTAVAPASRIRCATCNHTLGQTFTTETDAHGNKQFHGNVMMPYKRTSGHSASVHCRGIRTEAVCPESIFQRQCHELETNI
jgi:hypothetical protein